MLIRIILLIVLTFPLYGCVGAAMSGAQAVYNRHNLQKNFDDEYIAFHVREAINSDKKLNNTNVSVATFNRMVVLTGQVSYSWQQVELAKTAKKIPGVRKVYVLTTVSESTTTLIQISDAWITAKIKSKLIAANEVDPSQIKVITENGTVYLIGIVLPSQAKAAVYLARTTEGVQSVVRIFSYLKISKEMQ